MPGLRPTPPPPPEPEDDLTQVEFSYILLQSQTGDKIFAMTFHQIIEFLDNIENTLDEDEEIVADHFDLIKRVLRRYIRDDE